MVLRVIGIGLLVIIGLPLAIAFSPLVVLGLGVWLVATRLWPRAVLALSPPGLLRSAPARSWSRWQPPTLANHTVIGASNRPAGGTGRVLLILLIVVIVLSVISAVAEQAPWVLGALLVGGGVLAVNATKRRRSRSVPAVAAAPIVPVVPALTDAELERRTVRLLQRNRYQGIQAVGRHGEPGIDLLARDQHGHLFLVQCQQYAPGDRAGSADVQRLIDAVRREQAAGCIFVTTAGFTQAAINLAQYSRVPIILYDGRALASVPGEPALAWSAA